MARSDKDHARQLLELAAQDHTALENMLEPSRFPEQVFGFHAQQCVEKALKAWIASLGLVYPKSHDLSAMVQILAGVGVDSRRFSRLEELTIFAVQYRYEAYDAADEPLDRTSIVRQTGDLLADVRRAIGT